MEAIDFPGSNIKIAENRPEYETLPVMVAETETVCCMKLSDKDIQNVINYGKVWVMFSKRFDQPMTPFTLGFVDDVFDPGIEEPRWGYETNNIPVEPSKAHITFTNQVKMTFWQRLKYLLTGKDLTMVGALDVECKYQLDFTVKNITIKDLHYPED